MKKFIIGCFALFLFSQNMFGQNEAILRDAQTYSKAMVKSDFETMIKFTSDEQINLSGGPTYFIKDLENEAKVRQGFMEFKDVNVQLEGDQVVYLEQLQAIVLQEFIVDFGGQPFKVYQHLFATSNDKGENWTFVDLTQHDAKSIVEFFPNFSSELKFPEPKEAVAIVE